tara:strand:- start:586 stop:1344 length:759 start_codon:yes stop_codon:yes gene_type:complete
MKFNLKNTLKNKLTTVGSWVSIGDSVSTEIMCQNSFDWLTIDMEHTGISNKAMVDNIRIIDLYNLCPIVRVPSKNSSLIKIALDAGARGIIVPMINNVNDAQEAVNNVYYNPDGNRGTGLYRAQKYGKDFENYRKSANKNISLIVQIEHYEAVDNLDDIMSIKGIDGFIVGPYDLSASINQAGKFESKEYLKLLNKIESYINKNKKPGGYHVVHSDKKFLDSILKKGYKFIAYGVDMIFLSEKVSSSTKHFK